MKPYIGLDAISGSQNFICIVRIQRSHSTCT